MQGLGACGGFFIGCGGGRWSAVVVLLDGQYSPFRSTKALKIETLLGNQSLAFCDNVINVSVRMTRVVMEED